MSSRAIVVGAGVIGRMIGLSLARVGWQVRLVDRGDREGTRTCTWAALGMISPYCAIGQDPVVTRLGQFGLEAWPDWLEGLSAPVFHGDLGMLALAHPRDRSDLVTLHRQAVAGGAGLEVVEPLDGAGIADLEPELADRFREGLFFPHEQHLDNRALLSALAGSLEEEGVECHWSTEVSGLEPGRVVLRDGMFEGDWVVDTRGLGARTDLPNLRGVRGERLVLHAPGVGLSRPVRVMHPRFNLFLVPRPGRRILVGATSVESESEDPVGQPVIDELLAAAAWVHPGLRRATLLEACVHHRPALPEPCPRIFPEPGLIRINGLNRFGLLVSPALAAIAVDFMTEGSHHDLAEGVMEEWSL
ncbi:MAG TPA: FAD-dependent oxidoreductase [Kiritimatiellia bacterium]|nr:FAD-dependent oxidoreductase [Kiritimatiellia bacterium]